MGKGERGGGGGEMSAGVRGRSKYKIHQCHPVLQCRDFFQSQAFFVDYDSGLSAIGSVC